MTRLPRRDGFAPVDARCHDREGPPTAPGVGDPTERGPAGGHPPEIMGTATNCLSRRAAHAALHAKAPRGASSLAEPTGETRPFISAPGCRRRAFGEGRAWAATRTAHARRRRGPYAPIRVAACIGPGGRAAFSRAAWGRGSLVDERLVVELPGRIGSPGSEQVDRLAHPQGRHAPLRTRDATGIMSASIGCAGKGWTR